MTTGGLGKTRILNWKRSPPDGRDYRLSALRIGTLPPSVDLEERCPPVEDQGHIGSCTANAGTSAVEFITKPYVPLSRLFLYFATRVWIENDLPTDDNGAFIRDVMKALATYGVCKESLMPYDLTKWTFAPSEEAKAEALDRQIVEYRRCDSLDSIKFCLSEGFPAEGGFDVPESFMGEEAARTGIVKELAPGERFAGGHAVLFVGYDDATQMLKFQNSWGKAWGQRGFGFLPYSYVLSGNATDFWTIRMVESVDQPTPPTPEPVPVPEEEGGCWVAKAARKIKRAFKRK